MSVVAWDGKTIAADKQATTGDMRATSTKLIRSASGDILGFTGGAAEGLMMAKWYEDGADPAKWPAFQQTDDWCRLIVLSRDGLKHYERHPIPMPIEDPFIAFGSGRELAMGAMAFGATARQAIEIACRFETGCGMGIDEFHAPI